MNKTEQWRDITGYEGRYQVSNKGNVRSQTIIRYQKSSHDGVMMYKRFPGKILSATDNGNGYKIVGLQIGSKRKNYYVHRLVAQAFIENPQNLPEVNHKDYNKNNNSSENLEWVTRKENVIYSLPNTHKPRKKVTSSTGEKYVTIRKNKYRLQIRNGSISYDNLFRTLQEAVQKREELLRNK